MAPFKQQRKSLHSTYEHQGAVDELQIQARSYNDYPTSTATSGLAASSTNASSTSSPLSEAAATSTSTQTQITADTGNHSLSPTAQHVLVSAAVIGTPLYISMLRSAYSNAKSGALIFIGTIIYCVLRFLKIDVLGRFHKFARRRRSTWRPGSYSGTENYVPPYVNLNDEKFGSSTKKPYTPIVISPVPMAVLPSTQELSRADIERQNMVREALLSKLSDTALYHETLLSPPQPQPPRQPSIIYEQERPFSDLSSLSSGFGDAKIDIPESGPTRPRSQGKSRASRSSRNNNTPPRFSWSSNPTTLGRTPRGNRDTIYTANTTKSTNTTTTSSSEDSTPRFRSVNSWVSHQSKRIQRQMEHDREVDSMPAIPVPAPVKKVSHRRPQSEITDPGFKYHPGEEVPLSASKRVPSAILDKII